MIFLSAQPANQYFVWQLEIQIQNFLTHGINPTDIFVLFSKDPQKKVHPRVQDFYYNYRQKINVFIYEDTRTSKCYPSSVRPNIIKQHFKAFPNLEKEHIFYHDSDIVFTNELPDFQRLNLDQIWYFSDTRSYIDSNYIVTRAGALALSEMCSLLDIDTDLVIANDDNAGGAQYLLKNVDFDFWDRIETDCELLYSFLDSNKARYQELYYKSSNKSPGSYIPISSWCADMWAVLWNGYKRAEIRIDSSLDFCWPHYEIKNWSEVSIFHNSGVDFSQKKKLFFKSEYHDKEPYDLDFGYLETTKCSALYVKEIIETAKNRRYDASDVTVIIPLRIDSDSRMENLLTITKYLKQHFTLNIIVLEADETQKIKESQLEGCIYRFIKDKSKLFHREFYNNYMAKMAQTNIIIKYDCDVIVAPNQLFNSILAIRHKQRVISYPYDGRFVNVSGAIRSYFIENGDIKFLSKYVNINISSFVPSFGGCCVLDRNTYVEFGMDNENFMGWGFEDQELCKRYKILGTQIGRENGALYHLDHERGTHSYFFDESEMLNSYKEYSKVSNMQKEELLNYIRSWSK